MTPGPGPSPVPDLGPRYRALAIMLLAEALEQWARLMLNPDLPVGTLILKLEQMISALRAEPFKVVTEAERKVQAKAWTLLELTETLLREAPESEASMALTGLVRELRR